MAEATPTAGRLAGLPPPVWINLDRAEERRALMTRELAACGVAGARRFAALDGRDGAHLGRLAGPPPPQRSPEYVACMLSHLSVIEAFLADGDAPVLMVMEDDCVLSGAARWPFDWAHIWARRPFNFDALQLSVINPVAMVFRLHRRHYADWSAAAYILTRPYAEKLMRLHRAGDRFRLDNLPHPRDSVEDMLFGSGVTYAMPLFTYRTAMNSSLDQSHIARFHEPSDRMYQRFWREKAPRIADWEMMCRPFGAFDARQPHAGDYIALPGEGRFAGERKAG